MPEINPEGAKARVNMNVDLAMSEKDIDALLRDMSEKVTQIHTTIYGHEGHGGIMKVIDKHETEIDGLKKTKWYGHGWAAGIAFAVSTAWQYLTGHK